VGAIVAAGKQGVPVVLDGFATTIAAGIVHALNKDAIAHVLAAHYGFGVPNRWRTWVHVGFRTATHGLLAIFSKASILT